MILFTLIGLAWAGSVEPVLKDAVSAAIRDHIATVRQMSAADVEVGPLGMADGISSCDELPAISVSSVPGEPFRGLTRLRVELTQDGHACGRFSLTPRIELYGEVPVAASAVEEGKRVAIEMRRVALSSVRGTLIRPNDGPFVATRTIEAGTLMTHRRVKREPAAMMGQDVEIVVELGGITITAEGRMLADAQLGDRVRVANLATDSVVQGILYAPGLVRAGGVR